MRKKAYGQYIDNHDVVVRFNLVPLDPKHVGARTTVRLLNFASSKKACGGGQGSLSTDRGRSLGELRAVMLWHRLSRGSVFKCVKDKTLSGSEVTASEIGPGSQRKLRETMKAIRKDLERLKVRAMKPAFAQELTSGAQAVLLAMGHCQHVSVYGLSSFEVVDYRASNGYHYRGRATLRVTGHKVHDWAMEAGAWRLLFAAGKISLCAT